MYIYMCLHPVCVALHRLQQHSQLQAPLHHRLVLGASVDGGRLLATDHAPHQKYTCIYNLDKLTSIYMCMHIWM